MSQKENIEWLGPLTMSALAVGVVGLALVATRSVLADVLLVAFVGLAYVVLFVVVLHLGIIGKKDVPTCNMKRVVSLDRQCPEAASDDVVECLNERLDAKILLTYAGLPAAAAVLMALTNNDAPLFALSDGLYLLSLAYAVWNAAKGDAVCRGDVWRRVGLALAASFLVASAVHGHVIQKHGLDLQGILSAVNIPTFIAYLILFEELWPAEPPIFIKKTYVRDEHTAYRRFVEDLGDQPDKCQPEPAFRPICSLCCQAEPPQHSYYWKLKQIVCNRDVEVAKEVQVGYPLIAAAYYSIYRGDLELAEKLMEVLSYNKSLDEKERAALQVLEVVYEAAANPPCNDPEVKRYAEKLNNIHTPGWSSLLKILAQIHLGYASPDHVATVKRGILKAIDRCNGDNLSIYYFALTAIDRIKPLCQNVQQPLPKTGNP